MSSGKLGRSYCVRFESDYPIDKSDRKLYMNEFSQFESTGLWLEYTTRKGTAYFANEENANEAYRSLNQRNNLNIRLDVPARSSDEYRSDRLKRQDYEENDIETSANIMFDVYGNKIPVLTSNEGKEYIPLECVEGSGFRLFQKLPPMQAANEIWNTKLKTYLLNQALLYIFMNKVHYDSNSIIPMINRILSDIGIDTKNSESVSSNHNNNQDSDIKPQDGIRMRPRWETLELDLPYKVQFLNDNTEGVNYIRLVKNEERYNCIVAETILHANSSQRILQPKPNTIYAAKYNNLWHRAYLKPGPMSEYFLIDIGIFVNEKLEIRSLPEDLVKLPGQAIRVKLTNGCTAKKDQILEIVASKLYGDGTYLIRPADFKSGFLSDSSSNSGKHHNFPFNKKTTPIKTTNDIITTDNNANQNQKLTPEIPKVVPTLNNMNNANAKPSLQVTDNFVNADRQILKQNNNNISITATVSGNLKKTPEGSVGISPASSTSSLNKSTNKLQMNKIQERMLNRSINDEKSVKSVKSSRKCVSDVLANTTGCMEFVDMGEENSFIAFILPSTRLDDICLLESITEDVKYNANYRPSVGDTVAVNFLQDGESETSSVRAVVLDINNNEYKVALVDYGKIIKVDKVMELPDKYKDILEYAACCPVDKDIMNKIKDQVRFNYSSEKNGEMIIDMDGHPCKILCGKWNIIPTFTENSNKQEAVFTIPPPNLIQSGETVKLICQENDYLAIRTRENFMLLKNILTELQAHEVEKLQSPPVTNQMVLFKEGNDLHRAQVKLITGNLIKVLKVDYGYTEVTDAGNLYYIGKFSKYGHTVLLLKLTGFEEGFESRMVQDYLKTLYKTVNFTVNSATTETIDLLLPNKISLTQKLTLLAKPPFKRLEDIPPPPELPIGEYTSVMLLHVQDIDHCDIAVTVCDTDIQEEFVKLSAKLPSCENISSSLVFNLGQVCVGKYDDGWYRACIKEIDSVNEQYLVYFFDFGNYEHVGIDDLRELPEDMASLGAMAIKCHIQGVFNQFNGNVPQSYKEKLMDCVGSEFKIKVLSKHSDSYNIEMPEL